MENKDQKPNMQDKDKKNFGTILLEELSTPSTKKGKSGTGEAILIPLLAVFTGLVIGGIFIIATSESVYAAFRESLGAGLLASWQEVANAYRALFEGAIGQPSLMVAAIRTGDATQIEDAFAPLLESLNTATPYIFVGLGVALGFRAGVFNIGAEGQVFTGAILGTYIGYSITGLSPIIHIPLTLFAGALGGAIWGFIPGWLKAKTGGHEVINTIMMNYIAFRLSDWLLDGPMQRADSYVPISPWIQESAYLPRLFHDPIRFHWGFFIALAMAFLVYWLLFKTTWGFNLRAVGANPNAAKYAGINVTKYMVLAMSLSGALAGLGGVNDVMGVNHNMMQSFTSGYGFDSIALALLGKNHPVGVVLAAILFGILRSGAIRMQTQANIPIDIISILQALILAFIAAPAIIRTIYRMKKPAIEENAVNVRSWGG